MSFSDDILGNILTRLPLKSFIRANCVSRSWQSLISEDCVRNKLPPIVSFVFQHADSARRDVNEPACYVFTSNTAFESVSLFQVQPSSTTLIDCCNGLHLFYSSTSSIYHVCNVITRKHLVLPRPSRKSQLSTVAFDPRHSQCFRVINFTKWHDQGADIEVFDSQHGEWSTHEVEWGLASNQLSATMLYSNGVLHLLAHPNRAVAVALDTMTCALIELPEDIENGCYYGELGGSLHFSVSDDNGLRVWVLRDREKGEWMLRYCVGVNMSRCRIVALHPEGEVVYIVVNDEKLVCYNASKKRAEGVWELGEGNLVGVWVYPFTRHLEDCLATDDWKKGNPESTKKKQYS